MKQPVSNKQSKNQQKKKPEAAPAPVVNPNLGKPKKIHWEGWVVVLTAVLYYINTLGSGHTLDDAIVITMNSFTKKGFSGFGGILSKDTMYGFIGGDNPLPGGRYRPLSVLTFAIEYQFFGDSPAIGHLINVILYAFTGWLFWAFLRKYVFSATPIIAFAAAMLFVIHPIHTEVVANIKSRDEILSLLCSLGSLYFLFAYTEGKHEIKFLILSSVTFFLGLFAKENTMMYMAIMPMALYCFSKTEFKSNLKYFIPHIVLAVIFIGIRASIIGNHHLENHEIMNDPFLHANFIQKYSTIFLTLLYYLKLLFYPYPLAYDYSYNQIPLTNLSDWHVLLSLVAYASLFAWAVLNIKRKSVVAFGILTFLITLFITSNLVFNIGAPMGERFLYMPTIGFCMAIAFLGYKAYEWLVAKSGKTISIIAMSSVSGVLLLVCGGETIARNINWANDINLYTHDVHAVPNNAAALQRCGSSFIYVSDSVSRGHCDSVTDKTKWRHYLAVADIYFQKSLQIYPQYVDGFLNYGCSKLKQYKFDSAQILWDSAEKYFHTHPMLKSYRNNLGHIYLDSANKWHNKGRLELAYSYLEKSKKLIPDEPEVYYNLGGYYFTIKDFAKAKENWQKCLELNPNHAQAREGLKAVGG